jgi:predicted DsbA family dithiol-disulfide isomerase
MVTIDIVSDIVCPWCFIGKRRLESALAMVRAEQPGLACTVRWHPFFLNPDTPPEGEPYIPFLARKFGDLAAVDALFARVRAAGRPYGLDYAFEKIALRANTLQAHRLIHWAQAQGDADAVIERLFVAQFQRGEHVGDRRLLAQIAGECGFDADAAAHYLAGDEDVAVVRGEERAAREFGIRQIPTYLVGGHRVVVGAEDPTVLAAAILECLAGDD